MPAPRALLASAEVLLGNLKAAERQLTEALDLIEALPHGIYDHPALADTCGHPSDAISDARAVVRGDIEHVRTWLGSNAREGE